MSAEVKKITKEILGKLAEVCSSQKIFNYAQDYLASAKEWKYKVANKSSTTVQDAKACLIRYKNRRDILMPYCEDAVKIIDTYFPIEISDVQGRPDTQLQKLAGATLQDLKN